MQSGALPCNAVVGSPRRGYWVSQSARQTCVGLPVGSYPVLAGQRENHREGFRFQPRACDNCRLKSLQFFSFLAFYPEPVTTELRQRSVPRLCSATRSPPGQQVPAANQAAIIPTPDRQDSKESPSSPAAVAGQGNTPFWYFRGAFLGLDVFPGMSGAGRGLEVKRNTGSTRGHDGPVTVAA